MNFSTFLATLLGVGLLSTAVFAQDMTAINKSNLEETSTVAEFDLETTMAVISSTTKAPAVQKQKVVISKPSPFLQSTRAFKKLNLAESAPRSITGSSTVSPNMSDVSVAKKPTFRQNKAAPLLKKVHDWMIVVLLVCVMFAMGCSITWAQVSCAFNLFFKLISKSVLNFKFKTQLNFDNLSLKVWFKMIKQGH